MLLKGKRHALKGDAARSSEQLINIVVVGEFNSGKSSVINLMLQRHVLPTSAEFTNMPHARVFLSDKEDWKITGNKGHRVKAKEFRNGSLSGDDIKNIEISVAAKDYSNVSITEVTVELDGYLSFETEELIEAADLVIWCTMGQRAWCLSEIDIVKEFPSRIHRHAILVITRADLLPSDEKKKLVRDRVEGAAAEYFDKIFMVECSADAIARSKKPASWKETGGRALRDGVVATVEHIRSLPDGWEEGFGVDGDNVIQLNAGANEPLAASVVEQLQNRLNSLVGWLQDGENAVDGDEIVTFTERTLEGLAKVNENEEEEFAELIDLATNAMTLMPEEPSSTKKALRCIDLLIQLESQVMAAAQTEAEWHVSSSHFSRLMHDATSASPGRAQAPK